MTQALGVLLPAADDRAEQHVVVAAEELGCTVKREVGSVLERPEVDGRRGGRIHDDRRRVCRRGLEVGQREQRVGGRLDPDEVGSLGRRSGLVELDVAEPPAAEQLERADRPVVGVLRDRNAGRARAGRAPVRSSRPRRTGTGARCRPRAPPGPPPPRRLWASRSAGRRTRPARRSRRARSSNGRAAPWRDDNAGPNSACASGRVDGE